MFGKNELKLLDDVYFRVLKREEYYIEFISVNTGHCWNAFSNQFESTNRITLYHKKSTQERKYSEYSRCPSVADAINMIKEFDTQFLKTQKENKDNSISEITRKLKVYEGSGYKYKSTPTIILKGEWLRKYGFDIGEDIEVRCEHPGELIIHKAT